MIMVMRLRLTTWKAKSEKQHSRILNEEILRHETEKKKLKKQQKNQSQLGLTHQPCDHGHMIWITL